MSCSEFEQKVFSPPEKISPPMEKKVLKACPVKKIETNNHKVLSHPSPPLTLSKRRERCTKQTIIEQYNEKT